MSVRSARARRMIAGLLSAVLILGCTILFFVDQSRAGFLDDLAKGAKKLGDNVGKGLKDLGDKAKDAAEKLKRDQERNRRTCRICGGTFYSSTESVCPSCRMRQASGKLLSKGTEAAKRGLNAAKDVYNKAVPKAQEYWKKGTEAAGRAWGAGKDLYQRAVPQIQQGLRRFEEAARNGAGWARKQWDQFEPSARRSLETLKAKGAEALGKIAAARESAAQWYRRNEETIHRRWNQIGDGIGRGIRTTAETLGDPEFQRKAKATITTILEIRRQIDDVKHTVTYAAVTAGLNIPVRTKHGRTTIGEAATSYLVEKYPYLAGSSLVEDPAAAVTAVICRDTDYFLTDLRILKCGGRHMSVTEVVEAAAPFDSDSILKCVAVAEACDSVSEAVSTGGGGADALCSVWAAVKALQ